MEEKAHKQFVDPQKALLKAQKYCAYQERSQQEVRDKLYSFGLHKKDVEHTISELISSGFLKEERFALAFAGGKFRTKYWGKIKIKKALIQKKVSEVLIRQALKSIDERAYRLALRKVIEGKAKKVAENNPLKKNYKVAQYAISKGYEPELVWEMMKDKME